MIAKLTSAQGPNVSNSSRTVVGGVVAAAILFTPSLAAAQGAGAGAMAVLKAAGSNGLTEVAYRHHKAAAPAAAAPTPTKPTLAASFGDWGVYVSQGAKSKICYALAQPKTRTPSALKRDASYVFISNRPGEGVRNEVSIIMGVPLKEGASDAKAEIGSANFDLVAKGQNAFVKNAAEEGQFVDTLKKRGSRLTIKIATARGQAASDTYSLSGVAQALERVAKECP